MSGVAAGPYLLGIDSGLTVTKAVIFSADGRPVAVGRCEIEVLKPRPRHVERDMRSHWQRTCRAIREAIESAGIEAAEIAAVGVSGHGDGIYLLDAEGEPLGPAVLSLDTRAASVIAAWREDGTLDAGLALTGQRPYAAAPAAVLRWIKAHEPERFARIRSVLSCKDWLRFGLTGRVATDVTDGSVSFTDPATHHYSEAAIERYGLAALRPALPPLLDSCEIAGTITRSAAAHTGLREGTPVAAGLHDVTASAVASGVIDAGMLSIVAGTFSINQFYSNAPRPSADWFCRSAFERGLWLNMSISPASSANIDWYLKQHCKDALDHAAREGGSPFDVLEPELAAAFASRSAVVYLPFLYGSPHSDDASGAFLGLQAWHERGHVMRGLLEGVVFNHRHHVDALRGGFAFDRARLTGGSSRSARVCQLFADALGLTIEVVDVEETGALAAALCGAVGVGLYPSLAAAVQASVALRASYRPQPQARAELERRYQGYRRAVQQLEPLWRSLRGDE